MGTPCFAGRILERVLEWPGGEVVGVFSQPDRPCGRGLECRPCEVKTLALERGLPVFQPERFKTPEAVALVRDLAADAILVAAYGLILPLSVLAAAPLGCINVHASLLPRYRGAAPIQRALLDGETSTGVTIMQMDEQMDHGPILLQRALAIGSQDTSETLHDALADLGGRLLVEALDLLALGRLTAVPQDHQAATYAPKLVKEDGLVNFARPASRVHDQVRGVHPWPGAYCVWDWNGLPGREPLRLSLEPGRVGPELERPAAPGTFLGLRDGSLAVACADREYLIPGLRPAGKKRMDAQGFYCGFLSRCQDEAAECPAECREDRA